MQKSKVQLKIQKLFKMGVLMGVKESYLLVRNLYGFCEHPWLTTKRLVDKRDWSQGILIFGLPAGFWFGWLFVLVVSRLFIKPLHGVELGPLKFGFWAQISFALSSFFTFMTVSLLAYLIWQVVQKERRRR